MQLFFWDLVLEAPATKIGASLDPGIGDEDRRVVIADNRRIADCIEPYYHRSLPIKVPYVPHAKIRNAYKLSRSIRLQSRMSKKQWIALAPLSVARRKPPVP